MSEEKTVLEGAGLKPELARTLLRNPNELTSPGEVENFGQALALGFTQLRLRGNKETSNEDVKKALKLLEEIKKKLYRRREELHREKAARGNSGFIQE